MTDNIYHIAYQLLAEYGAMAREETSRKIKRYTESNNYNALKTWYDIEEALAEIQNNVRVEATSQSTLETTNII